MSIFSSNSSPFDEEVEKATSDKNTTEDWGLIMEICDRVSQSPQNAKDCLRSIVKRLSMPDPHIVIPAITLLDACSSNCGKTFHLEIASRSFENDLRKCLNLHRNQPKVYEKLRALIKKWVEGDFKTDPQLDLIPSLYNKLRSEGHDFSSLSDTPGQSTASRKPYNEITNSKEEEDLAKAIELSLKETKHHQASTSSPATKKSTSLYPNVSSAMSSSSNSEGRKVLALYNFEADEDNELTFMSGEIINILDDSDANWWKGSNHRGEGLFPSNFVTADLTVEPEQLTKLEHTTKKSVQFLEEVEVKTEKREPEIIEVEIDEQKMDRLLNLLHDADPQSDSSDTQEMLDLEEQVTAMGPLIDTALEKVDRQHAQLTQLSSDLVDALNLYHTLMREPISNYTMPKMPPPPHMNYQYPNQGPPPPHMYNGMPPGPQAPFNARPPPRFNPNMPPSNEFMGPGSIPSLPQHYPMQPGQHPMPGPGQGPPVPDQSNAPFPPNPGFPMRGGPVGPYAPAGPPGPLINQPQYAPSNGQRMM